MTEDGQEKYYLQDDLGSPMLLSNEDGEIRESYAFDEFGQSLHHTPEGQLQPFGYTGYQMETAGGLYFAQARRYDARAGRFVSEDKIPGFAALPHTMNRYSYCWNQPMEHVDLDGRLPVLILVILLVAVVVVAVAVDAAAIHSVSMMGEHYRRNQNQEDYFAQFESDADIIRAVETGKNEDGSENGWKPAPVNQNAYHRFTNGTQGMEAIYNVKYLKEFPNGTSYEIVICQGPSLNDDYIVKDPVNVGTYNYCSPNDDDKTGTYIGHFWNDILPYWFLSNTLDDDLTLGDRLFGSDNLGEGKVDYIKHKLKSGYKKNKICID